MSAHAVLGKYANRPYYMEGVRINIYSAEELSYCIISGAYILDETFMQEDLVDWINRELGLSDLAGKLSSMLTRRAGIVEFVDAILSYTCFVSPSRKQEVLLVYKENSSLGIFERRKKSGDHLAAAGKFGAAMGIYSSLIKEIPAREAPLRSRVFHNMGVITARLFLFDEAAKLFMASYEAENSRETYIQYLAAKRMAMGSEEYIRWIGEKPEDRDVSLLLEEKLEHLGNEWNYTEERAAVQRLHENRMEGNTDHYNEEAARYLEQLKKNYRCYIEG